MSAGPVLDKMSDLPSNQTRQLCNREQSHLLAKHSHNTGLPSVAVSLTCKFFLANLDFPLHVLAVYIGHPVQTSATSASELVNLERIHMKVQLRQAN